MVHMLHDQMVEVFLTGHEEVIQAFDLARLYPAFDMSVLIRIALG